jgi:hypothetical protein
MQANAATAQPVPPNTVAQTKDYNRHIRRQRILASILISHIGAPNLKLMIQAAHPRDGYEAWLLLRANCLREPNDLTLLVMNKTWADCDFKSMGIDESSLNNTTRNLPRCFRCQGIGHVTSDCGNSANTIISIADAQAVLAQQRRPGGADSGARPAARRSAPSASASRRPAAAPRRDRALAVSFDDNPVGEDDGDVEGDAVLACVYDEVEMLGEDDPSGAFDDDAAFAAFSLN